MRPPFSRQRTYLFFAAFFFPPFAFFAIENSSLHWWIAGSSWRRRTLPPGTSARRCGDLASWADPCAGCASGEQQLAMGKTRDKKMGCSASTPKVKAEELPLLRGLFLSALGCLLRHFFLLRLL
jgi:hypothetical protein